uniref:Alginate lyase 2 domain-containing protein n=1 Tax=Aegilops tauschii TaxID=37682 RepID=M8B8R4_AEGTA
MAPHALSWISLPLLLFLASSTSVAAARGAWAPKTADPRRWVHGDKPHDRQSHTSPRTEIRMAGYDYSSGLWQFEAYGYVPSGTTGVSIMQVFDAGETATTLMLHVYDGALRYYDRQIVEDAI